jgi:hypothetical protein
MTGFDRLTDGQPRVDGLLSDRRLLNDPLLYTVAAATVAACLPYFRYVLWLGDEGVFLHAAQRMLRGEVIYRDFFEFLPPGSFLLVASWMKVFGATFASARVLAISVIVSIAVLLYVSVRLTSEKRAPAALLTIAWISVSQGGWTVVSHHWFTTACSVASAVCLLVLVRRDGVPRPLTAFTAGLFAGAAAMVTPTRGALLCLAIVGTLLTLSWPRLGVGAAIAGIVVIPTAMVLYLAARDALVAAFADVILYPATHYAGIQAVTFGDSAIAGEQMAVAFFPLTFTLAVFAGVTMWRLPLFRASLALALVGLLGAYPRPDIVHLNFTLPLLCPLFAVALGKILGRLRRRSRRFVGPVLTGLCLLAIGYALMPTIRFIGGSLQTIPTARGPIVRREDQRTKDLATLVALIDRIPQGDAFFFYPYSPMLPYLTGRRHVAGYDVMTPGYTTPEQFREICLRTVDGAHWVVVDRMWVDSRWLRYVFPAMRDPEPKERREFETAIQRAFDKPVHVSKHFILMRRSENPSLVLCDGITASADSR